MNDFPELETTSLSRERAAHARDGTLTLQICGDCGRMQYPSRYVCQDCLSGEFSWSGVSTAGRVLSRAVVHAGLHSFFRERAPWQICSVVLDAGPRVIAHVADETIESGDIVDVHDQSVGTTQCVLIAQKRVKTLNETLNDGGQG